MKFNSYGTVHTIQSHAAIWPTLALCSLFEEVNSPTSVTLPKARVCHFPMYKTIHGLMSFPTDGVIIWIMVRKWHYSWTSTLWTKRLNSPHLIMGSTGNLKTLSNSYKLTLCHIPEKWRQQLYHDKSLQSHKAEILHIPKVLSLVNTKGFNLSIKICTDHPGIKLSTLWIRILCHTLSTFTTKFCNV